MRVLIWLAAVLLFFFLLAFALNNQHVVTVHWFFGHAWTAPMIVVVLSAFALGVVLSMLALAPRRWRERAAATQASGAPPPAAAPQTEVVLQPPRPD